MMKPETSKNPNSRIRNPKLAQILELHYFTGPKIMKLLHRQKGGKMGFLVVSLIILLVIFGFMTVKYK